MEYKYDKEKLKIYKDNKFSQDNLLHTLLGLFKSKLNFIKKIKIFCMMPKNLNKQITITSFLLIAVILLS